MQSDYETSQILTGQGCFHERLHELKLSDVGPCYSGEAELADVHTPRTVGVLPVRGGALAIVRRNRSAGSGTDPLTQSHRLGGELQAAAEIRTTMSSLSEWARKELRRPL